MKGSAEGMLEALKTAERAMIVHHWDADGICSASILYEALEGHDVDWMTPILGNYHLTQREIARVSEGGYDTIIVADMPLPRRNLVSLKDRAGAEVFLVDHHSEGRIHEIRHINPIAEGRDPNEFPSTSWVLTSSLGRPIDLLSVLGASGDHGERLKSFSAFQDVEDFMRKKGLGFGDLLGMVELVDSNYIMGDVDGVRGAVLKILEYRDDPLGALDDRDWNEKVVRVRDEVGHQLTTPETRMDRVILKEIRSRYNVISSVTRKVARTQEGCIAVVVNKGFFEDRDQTYVRCDGGEADLLAIVKEAESRGYSAGGREGVIGIISPKAETDRLISRILDLLLSRNG